MTGPTEGRLSAYLDGELPPSERTEVERWLREPSVRAELEVLRDRRDRTRRALAGLAHLDPPTPDLQRARRAVEERAAARMRDASAESGVTRLGAGAGRRMARAAVVVLFLGAAGASAAVPGSPVRGWIEGLVAGDGAGPAPSSVPAVASPVDVAPEDAGLRVAPAAGRLEIELTGVGPDRPVRVTMVDGERGAVYARDASFRSGEGRIEAVVEGSGSAEAGVIRVEIPRAAATATLRVDGVTWLEKRGDRIDYPGPPADVTGDAIRFGGGAR